MRKILLFAVCLAFYGTFNAAHAQDSITFESFTISNDGYLNGISQTYGYYTTYKTDSIFKFRNQFSRDDIGYGMYDSWSGFAYSKDQNDSVGGLNNQFSAIPASGANGSQNYAVISGSLDTVWLTEQAIIDSVRITNSTYTYFSMKEGDTLTKKFGGESGDDPDWFKLKISGFKDGTFTDSTVFYLADFRDANNGNDYIIDTWEKVDLTGLGTVDMLTFELSSSDTGQLGKNTTAYFCMDNLGGADFEAFTYISGNYWNGKTALFGDYYSSFDARIANLPNKYSVGDIGWGITESWSGFAISNQTDTLTPGFFNQYSAIAGSGAQNSANYVVCSNSRGMDTIFLNEATTIAGAYFTNNTYAALSMKNGDMFTKKFGGESGDDPDWFKLTITGLNNAEVTDSINFYLADYRDANNNNDYIVTDWQWVDLTSLGEVEQITFKLSSSDVGQFGMNTPAFFCLDHVKTQKDQGTFITKFGTGPAIKVYPNPAISEVHIASKSTLQQLTVYDLSGKPVFNKSYLGTSNHASLNLQRLVPGVYMIQIKTQNNEEIQKLIIQ